MHSNLKKSPIISAKKSSRDLCKNERQSLGVKNRCFQPFSSLKFKKSQNNNKKKASSLNEKKKDSFPRFAFLKYLYKNTHIFQNEKKINEKNIRNKKKEEIHISFYRYI